MVDFAGVALVDPRGWVLLQERDAQTALWPRQWCFPGGHLEPGETALDCALRECAEETGVRLRPDALTSLGEQSVVDPDGKTRGWELFAARTDLGREDVECREGVQLAFRDPTDLADLDLVTSDRDVVAVLLEWLERTPAEWGEKRFAGVLLVDARGRVLLQERDEHPLIDPERWGLPGGHVEPDETFAAAAPRELFEETGVLLPDGALRLWGEFVVDHRAAHGTWDQMQVFAAQVDLHDSDIECHEGRRIIFVEPSDIQGLPLTRAAEQILGTFLSQDGVDAS